MKIMLEINKEIFHDALALVDTLSNDKNDSTMTIEEDKHYFI